MDRWWTDPEQSAQALGRVDDSDVVQGVGTAVLAYHGLSEAVLRPLTQRTLVDGQQIEAALDGLDLEPVAKALSAATFPVMGESAPAYGRMLAEQIHKEAVDSTTRLVTHLVATGMAWPTAVERAASVHGVPVERLGKAGGALKAPSLARMAQADIADRTLMSFAKHVGLREDTRDVVTKAAREREFKEENIKRDALGRFADKPDTSLGGLKRQLTDSEIARYREKQQRRAAKRRKGLKRVEQKDTGRSLLDILRAGQQTKEQATQGKAKAKPVGDDIDRMVEDKINQQVEAKIKAQVDAKVARLVNALANRKKNPLATPPDDTDLSYPPEPYPKKDNGKYEGYVNGSDSQQLFMLASKEVLELALQQGKFDFGKLRDVGGVFENELYNREELRDAVLDYSYSHSDALDDVAVLVFDGDVAYHASFTQGYEPVKPADPGMYAVTHRNRLDSEKLEEDDYYLDMDLKVYVTPGMAGAKKSISLPNLTVVLANEDDFDNMPGGRIKKMWNENEVVRDRLGRFAEEGQSGITPSQERKKTMANRKQNKQRKKLKRVQQDTTSASLLTALQAGQTQRQDATATQSRAAAQGDPLERLIQSQMDAQVERKIQGQMDRAVARQAQKLADRREALDDFRFAHEEWKQMDAAVFSSDHDMLTLQELFNYDPFNNDFADFGSRVGDEERAEIAEYAVKPRSTQDIAEGLNANSGKTRSVLSEKVVLDEGYHLPDAFNAYALAATEADDKNRASNDSTREWLPTVDIRQESVLGYPTYVPAIVEVTSMDTDVVVLGSKADWAAVKRGEAVTLEPLPGYDDFPDRPGVGLFNDLFAATGSDESYGKWLEQPTRSDFYVRAFRIKR